MIEWTRTAILTITGYRIIMVGRRRGRNRRVVEREPNGRAVRAKAETREQIAAGMPHRAGLAEKFLTDHRAECALGRRFLMGQITEVQYDAGVLWRDLVSRYARVINAPMPSPRSSAGSLMGSNGAGRDLSTEEAERIRTAYNAAYIYMMDKVGHRALQAVSHCAVYDRDPNMDYLAVGLQALSVHFRLTEIRKSVVTNRQSHFAS